MDPCHSHGWGYIEHGRSLHPGLPSLSPTEHQGTDHHLMGNTPWKKPSPTHRFPKWVNKTLGSEVTKTTPRSVSPHQEEVGAPLGATPRPLAEDAPAQPLPLSTVSPFSLAG